MHPISEPDIRARIARDNYWWAGQDVKEAALPRRVYFSHFKSLALNFAVRRATVLMGPRRVGKTVMVKQVIAQAISEGIDRRSILYAAIDAPIYSGTSLEQFVSLLPDDAPERQKLIVFDEIQYLKNWELHLKDLVDTYPDIKFVATGSAAAALRLKSRESGAGRFTEFMLPPLTFYEFLRFIEKNDELITIDQDGKGFSTNNIHEFNKQFVDYLNFGGYPEAVLNPEIRRNPDQFIRNDIIEKVLLKDLPSLYGISEIQELNKLFSFLAYNAGNEASLDKIAQGSGLAKPTIKKYVEYLESAFLVMKIRTVDDNCRTMTRERNFKIYLNNPSMRAALFAPVDYADSTKIGHLAECAVFSQWQHSPNFGRLRYARWRNEGEVDVVFLGADDEKPSWIGEVKWSDRVQENAGRERRAVVALVKKHKSIKSAFFTTKTLTLKLPVEHITINVMPTALYCYMVGRNITSRLDAAAVIGEVPKVEKPKAEKPSKAE